MPDIHHTAIVHPHAELADDVSVGPYSLVGPDVVIGPGTSVGAHCVVENHTSIGAHNRIGHHVHLGGLPQDLKYRGELATVEIGDNNEIRENVTVHIGTENGGGSTSIGSNNFLMVGAHIAHDSHIGDNCILSNNVMLAGHIIVNDHAIISGGAAVTHYVTIGRYAFVGGLAGVVHDCPPFMVSDGHPNRVRTVNTIGLARHQFDATTIDHLKRAYIALYGHRARKNHSQGQGGYANLDLLERDLGDDPAVMELVEFIRRSAAAPNGRFAEVHRPDNKRTAPTR
ncbi:MAG: acyl-ACP--UDP-N-acetylglucosamine O-acyltransferase [Phycisphaeraceae bacterium]